MSTIIKTTDAELSSRWDGSGVIHAVDHGRNYGPCRPARRVYTRISGPLPVTPSAGDGKALD